MSPKGGRGWRGGAASSCRAEWGWMPTIPTSSSTIQPQGEHRGGEGPWKKQERGGCCSWWGKVGGKYAFIPLQGSSGSRSEGGARPGAALKGHPDVIKMALCGDSGVPVEPCGLLKCSPGSEMLGKGLGAHKEGGEAQQRFLFAGPGQQRGRKAEVPHTPGQGRAPSPPRAPSI